MRNSRFGARFSCADKRHIEAEVINLEPGYAGPIEIGATLKFAEDEIVDAYT